MKTIKYNTLIDCTIEELFDFHLDSNNITKITPKNIKVDILNDDTYTYEGKILKLEITKFLIPLSWEVKIEKIQSPNIVIDKAISSPFKYWRHQHIFTKKGNMCELKDIIEYEIPFGILGKIFEPFIELDITKMFEYRHIQTKKILESKLTKKENNV
jgi:ligand-binding SRPBCC domain-containing protein